MGRQGGQYARQPASPDFVGSELPFEICFYRTNDSCKMLHDNRPRRASCSVRCPFAQTGGRRWTEQVPSGKGHHRTTEKTGLRQSGLSPRGLGEPDPCGPTRIGTLQGCWGNRMRPLVLSASNVRLNEQHPVGQRSSRSSPANACTKYRPAERVRLGPPVYAAAGPTQWRYEMG